MATNYVTISVGQALVSCVCEAIRDYSRKTAVLCSVIDVAVSGPDAEIMVRTTLDGRGVQSAVWSHYALGNISVRVVAEETAE
jgi:hypothetical protein